MINYASKLLKGKIIYRIINYLCTAIWQMHFSLSKTHCHYFIIYTIISTNILKFILTLQIYIYLAGKLAWSLDTVIAMWKASKTDNQFHYFGCDTVFPLANLSSPPIYFFPHFQFHDQLPVSFSFTLYQKVNLKLYSLQMLVFFAYPLLFFSPKKKISFHLPDCPSHLQCRPANAHLPKAAWKAEGLLLLSHLLWWPT